MFLPRLTRMVMPKELSTMLVRRRLGRAARFTRYLVPPPRLMVVALDVIAVLCVFYSYSAVPPEKLPDLVNGRGPGTCLWVFVRGVPGKVYGPFFAIGTPCINLIEGALLQFTALV